MGESTHTIKVEADTIETENKLARCIELAERLRAVWGDLPTPRAIERLEIQPGDHLVLRYEGHLDGAVRDAIKGQVEVILPGVRPVVLDGGLHLEGVFAADGKADDATQGGGG